jgi:hypothetical protein
MGNWRAKRLSLWSVEFGLNVHEQYDSFAGLHRLGRADAVSLTP